MADAQLSLTTTDHTYKPTTKPDPQKDRELKKLTDELKNIRKDIRKDNTNNRGTGNNYMVHHIHW